MINNIKYQIDELLQEETLPKLGIKNINTNLLLQLIMYVKKITNSISVFESISKRYNIKPLQFESFYLGMDRANSENDIIEVCKKFKTILVEAKSYELFCNDLESKEINKKAATNLRAIPSDIKFLHNYKDSVTKMDIAGNWFINNK